MVGLYLNFFEFQFQHLFSEWFTLSNKDKFAGKVYLELTFWSNVSTFKSVLGGSHSLQAPPPEKKVTPRPPKSNKQYAGPGSFVPSNESPSRIGPSSVYANPRPPSDTNSVAVPSSLRSSNSLAKFDLYVPPYEKPVTTVSDSIASEFNDMGISQHRGSLSVSPVPSFTLLHDLIWCSLLNVNMPQ